MIDVRTLQRALKSKGAYTGSIDGDYGPRSKAAAREVVAQSAERYSPDWSDGRVRIALEQLIMHEAGIETGAIDGIEGVMTQYAWEVWQNRMRTDPGQGGLGAGSPAFCHQDDAEAFYGAPGTGHVRLTLPYTVYYGSTPMTSFYIHQKCADSAQRAMEAVLAHYGADQIHALGIDRYGGCYNNRNMRGGSRKSMHAYACAIDWDPQRNPLRADHRTAVFARPEYAAFLDAWEAQGWTSLGRARDFDWMHVQAADL